MTPEMKQTLLDALLEINEAQLPIEGTGAIIIHKAREDCLSGVPYLWSSDRTRDFVFPNAASAQAFVDTFELLADVYIPKH